MWAMLGEAPRKAGKPANCEPANSCGGWGALCMGGCCITAGLRACGFQGVVMSVGVNPRAGGRSPGQRGVVGVGGAPPRMGRRVYPLS